MPIRAAQLIVEIAADISKLTKGAAEANGLLGKVGKSMAIAGAGMTAAITLPAIGAAAGMLKVAMSMEQSQIAFTTMLKSGEKATVFLKDLREFAKSTPFEFTELQDASRRLLAMGFAAEKILPMMTNIGDAVSGLGLGAEGVDRVTLALGQLQAKGKVSGQEMMQLTEAGIPAWKYLAESMGKSTAEVMKMSEQGLIPAGQAIDYILAGMNKDFGGMMAAQSKTAAGQLSNLKDVIVALAADMGESLLPIAKELIAKAQGAVQYFNDLTDAGKKNVLVWIGIAAAAGPATTILGGAVATIGKLIPMVQGLGAAFSLMAGASSVGGVLSVASLGIAGLTAVALPAAAAVVAVAIAWDKLIPKFKELEKIKFSALEKHEQDMRKANVTWREYAIEMVRANNVAGELTPTQQRIADALLDGTLKGDAYNERLAQMVGELNLVTETNWTGVLAQQGMNDMVAQGIPYFGFLGDAVMYTNDSLVALGDGTAASTQLFEEMIAGASRTKESLGGLLGEVKNIQTEMNNWVTNTAGSVQSMLGQKLPESSAAYRQGLEAIDEVMGTQYTKQLDLNIATQALLDLYADNKNVDAFKEGLKKIKEEGLAGMEEQLKTVTEKAQELYEKLIHLPKNIKIEIDFDVKDYPQWLNVDKNALWNPKTDVTRTALPKALGGPVYSGLSYLVGERGPELFQPSVAGTIIPNQHTSTKTTQVTVFNQGGEPMTEDGLARAIAQWEWAYGV